MPSFESRRFSSVGRRPKRYIWRNYEILYFLGRLFWTALVFLDGISRTAPWTAFWTAVGRQFGRQFGRHLIFINGL